MSLNKNLTLPASGRRSIIRDRCICKKTYGFLDLKKGSYPVSEKAAESVLSLPNYPEMTDEMVEFVAGKVKEFARQGSR